MQIYLCVEVMSITLNASTWAFKRNSANFLAGVYCRLGFSSHSVGLVCSLFSASLHLSPFTHFFLFPSSFHISPFFVFLASWFSVFCASLTSVNNFDCATKNEERVIRKNRLHLWIGLFNLQLRYLCSTYLSWDLQPLW